MKVSTRQSAGRIATSPKRPDQSGSRALIYPHSREAAIFLTTPAGRAMEPAPHSSERIRRPRSRTSSGPEAVAVQLRVPVDVEVRVLEALRVENVQRLVRELATPLVGDRVARHLSCSARATMMPSG